MMKLVLEATEASNSNPGKTVGSGDYYNNYIAVLMSATQTQSLETAFSRNKYPNKAVEQTLADDLGMPLQSVNVRMFSHIGYSEISNENGIVDFEMIRSSWIAQLVVQF